jgi:hypothetical protein
MVNLSAICAQKYDSVHAHSAHALHVLRALQYSHFPPAIRTRISLVQGNYVGLGPPFLCCRLIWVKNPPLPSSSYLSTLLTI